MRALASVFSPKTLRRKADPSPPPSSLKTVEHDAPLQGDGTTVSPLGLANGAVNASKLSAAAVPSVGQVLGFNGANLAWQDASVGGGIRVVDSLGQVVGPWVGPGTVFRRVGSETFWLGVNTNGFIGGRVLFYHASPDCSGPRYLDPGRTLFNVIQGQSNGSTLLYGGEPTLQIIWNSFEEVIPPNDINEPGQCWRVTSEQRTVGLPISMDYATLGLTPPFHLEF